MANVFSRTTKEKKLGFSLHWQLPVLLWNGENEFIVDCSGRRIINFLTILQVHVIKLNMFHPCAPPQFAKFLFAYLIVPCIVHNSIIVFTLPTLLQITSIIWTQNCQENLYKKENSNVMFSEILLQRVVMCSRICLQCLCFTLVIWTWSFSSFKTWKWLIICHMRIMDCIPLFSFETNLVDCKI